MYVNIKTTLLIKPLLGSTKGGLKNEFYCTQTSGLKNEFYCTQTSHITVKKTIDCVAKRASISGKLRLFAILLFQQKSGMRIGSAYVTRNKAFILAKVDA